MTSLIPLLTRGLETQVVLDINLANEEEELLAVKGTLEGNVRHSKFRVRQHLVVSA